MKIKESIQFLKKYADDKGLHISELFSKETLVENSDWRQAVEEERKATGCSKKEAKQKIYSDYFSKSYSDLWNNHITDKVKGILARRLATTLSMVVK